MARRGLNESSTSHGHGVVLSRRTFLAGGLLVVGTAAAGVVAATLVPLPDGGDEPTAEDEGLQATAQDAVTTEEVATRTGEASETTDASLSSPMPRAAVPEDLPGTADADEVYEAISAAASARGVVHPILATPSVMEVNEEGAVDPVEVCSWQIVVACESGATYTFVLLHWPATGEISVTPTN